MRIDWWTLGLQTVNVLVLLWILRRFLFRPVAGILQARREAAARELAEADAARREADAARAQAVAEAEAAAGARRDLLEAAQQAAAHEKAALVEAARAEAAAMLAAAQARREAERARDEDALSDRAARLAVEIAARALARLPEALRVAPFIDGLAAAAADLPEATRRELVGAPLPVRTPRPLEEDERAALEDALSRALGGPVRLAPSVDATLVAGLEIEGAHGSARNHLRADLDRMAAELTRHDD